MRLAPTTLLLAFAACSHKSANHRLAKDEAQKLLIDRNWIDRWPTSKADKLHVYRFVPNMGGGVFQNRTVFRGTFELFQFSLEGDHIQFDLPETGERIRSQYRIVRVEGPHPFDLKLTVANDPRGPIEYYGIRSEHDPDGHRLEQAFASLKK